MLFCPISSTIYWKSHAVWKFNQINLKRIECFLKRNFADCTASHVVSSNCDYELLCSRLLFWLVKGVRAGKMRGIYFYFSVLLHLTLSDGAKLIDRLILGNLLGEDARECSSLISLDLVNEIRSYQPIVDGIVAAATNSDFSGSTWNRWVT